MANTPPPVPTYNQPIADDKGATSRSWYFYLQYLGQQIKTLTAAVSAIVGLTPSGVTAGSYTSTNLTVNSFGIVTAAASGGSGTVTSIGSTTLTIGGTSSTPTVNLSTTQQLNIAAGGTALQTAAVIDSITGNGTSASPLQLSGDAATPGANKVYGTNASGTKGFYAAPSGGSYPLNIVQWAPYQSGTSNIATTTFTWPQTCAASGNTLFALLALDGSQTFTVPSGWAVDFNQAATTYSRVLLMHKASASDTSVSLSYPTASSFAGLFFEVSGTHALDQVSVGFVNSYSGGGNLLQVAPAITPSAGAAVFAGWAYTSNGSSGGYEQTGRTPPSSANWNVGYAQAYSNIAGRGLVFAQYTQPAPGSLLINPPSLFVPGWSYYGGGGLAYATFSIL